MCTHIGVGNSVQRILPKLLLTISLALELIPGVQGALPEVSIRAVTSNEATVDVNGDGEIWVGNEQNSKHLIYGVNSISVSKHVLADL